MKNQIDLTEHYFISYFRTLLNIPFSYDITHFLLKKSNISLTNFEKKWNNFNDIFWKKYWNKISALSFATIIESHDLLLNKIISEKKEKTLIIELASWFTPRWLNLIKSWKNNFIETDKKNVIELKKEFYDSLNKKWIKTPKLEIIDVLEKKDFDNIYNVIKLEKLKNDSLKEVVFLSEWLLIYLSKEEQKKFFDNLRHIWKLLKDLGIKTKYLTIDMPTHENFTNWLIHEDFSFKDHLDVMSKVDPIIIESLYNTEKDFLIENWLNKINKYYYPDDLILSLKTPKLDKYRKIDKLFLKQDILFAWEVEL